MPQVFKIGSYIVYFWLNEGMPIEPVHIHIEQGTPAQNGTKIWLTKMGRALLANNGSKIPERQLRIMMDVIEARHQDKEIDVTRLISARFATDFERGLYYGKY